MLTWVDIETTGLDHKKDSVLEVGMVLTDDDLNVIASRYYVILTKKRKLKRMNDFVRNMHTKSGLLEILTNMPEACLKMRHAELELMAFMEENDVNAVNNGKPELALMSGSSIHFDRRFLEKNMPDLCLRFGYRMLDVTSISEVVKRWIPSVYHTLAAKYPASQTAHRTLDDCFESINKLAFYRAYGFVTPEHDYLVASGDA